MKHLIGLDIKLQRTPRIVNYKLLPEYENPIGFSIQFLGANLYIKPRG